LKTLVLGQPDLRLTAGFIKESGDIGQIRPIGTPIISLSSWA
jgi:hypothetical protein